jgi:hypothetical protein
MRYGIECAWIAVVLAAQPVAADQVVLESVRDNTLYESVGGDASNGAGDFMFAGQASGRRRALVRFDVTAALPAGATVTAATLALHCSRSPLGAPNTAIGVHRLLADWGEGSSDAGDPGGDGAESTAGDATWVHRFYADSTWTAAGGDFVAAASASATIGTVGDYAWTSPGLAADVQVWLDAPAAQFGWILIGSEGGATNSRRFDTREHATAGFRPRLTIDYIPPVAVHPAAWSGVKALFR